MFRFLFMGWWHLLFSMALSENEFPSQLHLSYLALYSSCYQGQALLMTVNILHPIMFNHSHHLMLLCLFMLQTFTLSVDYDLFTFSLEFEKLQKKKRNVTFFMLCNVKKQFEQNKSKANKTKIIYSWRANNVNRIRFIVLSISKKLCHKSRRRSYLEFIRIAFRYAQIFFRYEPVSFLFRFYVSYFAKAVSRHLCHSPLLVHLSLIIFHV